MTIQRKKAITLMELMLVMVIIGVITAAGITISKSNSDYEKKLNLYIVQRDLSNAAKNIATVGSRVYVTEYTRCRDRNTSTYVCNDNSKTTRVTGILPYVSNRSNSKDSNAAVNNYNYNRLLQGFCQRLAEEYGVSTTNNGLNCGNVITGNYIKTSGTSFATRNPVFTLPNGHAYYMMSDVFKYYLSGTTDVIRAVSITQASFICLENHINDMRDDRNLSTCSPYYDIPNALVRSSSYPSEVMYDIAVAAKKYIDAGHTVNLGGNDLNNTISYHQASKDFFVVYVDINGKMSSAADIAHGPDKLNSDIFTFLVLRSGIVAPAKETNAYNLVLARIYNRTNNGEVLTPCAPDKIQRYPDALNTACIIPTHAGTDTISKYFTYNHCETSPGTGYIELLKPSLR